MSVLQPGRAPRTDGELMVEINDRLRKLENSRSVRVGPWTLTTDPVTGGLQAMRPGKTVGLDGAAVPEVLQLRNSGGVTPEELTNAVMGAGDPGDLWLVKRIFSNLSTFLASINFNDPAFDPETAAQTFVSTVIQPLIDAAAALGKLSISWLTNEQQNMVTDGGYDTPVTIVEGSGFVHDATDGVPGSTPVGCAKVVCDGADHQQAPKLFEVGQGWTLTAGSRVKWETITTAGANPIRVDLQPYKQTGLDTFTPVGPQIMVASVAAPTGSSGGLGGWGTAAIQGNWTVPDDGTVSHVALIDHVTAAATGGNVKYDNTFMYPVQDIPQEWINGLIAQLTSLYDWIEAWVQAGLTALGLPTLGGLNDMINDLADGLSDIQNAAEDAMAGLADKLGLDQWDEQINELKDIFDGLVIDPLTNLGNSIGDWFGQFFRGGPKQVVTQDQVAAESGIPPLGANVEVPWDYLPVELMSVAMGMPWTHVVKTGTNQSIPTATDTLLTGWSQSGPGVITITGNKFKLPFDGMWNIEVFVPFNAVGSHQINLKQNSNVIRETPATLSTDRGMFSVMIPAATADEFSVWATTSTGSTTVITAKTFVRATYMGRTTVPSLPPAPDPVTFDAEGAGDYGGLKDYSWPHPFGPDSNCIVIPISHESPAALAVTCGPYTVPILSGPTNVGNYFGANSRYSLAAAILPDDVKGTTRTCNVVFGSGGQTGAGSANSMSFNGVHRLGEVKVSSGNSSPKLLVPANVSSMVACGFGGMGVNFSGFNRTEVDRWNFSPFSSWAHVMGYAVGGQIFTASGGNWAGKAIELSPVAP